MCEIIDDSYFFHKVANQESTPEAISHQKAQIQFLCQDSFSNLKLSSISLNKFQKYKATCIIQYPQPNVDIFLDIMFQGLGFLLTARIISDFSVLSVGTKQKRKILIKQLTKKTISSILQFSKIQISLANGNWYIKTPFYSNPRNLKQLKKQFHQTVESLVKCTIKIFGNIQKLLKGNDQQITESKKPKMHQLLRYYMRCTTAPSISIKSDCAQYQSVMRRYAASKFDLEGLVQQNKLANQSRKQYFKSLKIYGYNVKLKPQGDYLDQISLKQKQNIQEEICIPSYFVTKPRQNKYIFNHCYFLSNHYQQRKIGEGGNSEIFVLKPEIYEYSSTNSDEGALQKCDNITRYISKHVVFKKNKQKKDSVNKQNIPICKQGQILSSLRGGTCLFLPKYYLNIDKESAYNQKIFVEYLPGQTLDEYVDSNTETISIFTKIYLMIQVLQGLRFICGFGIVHLDIKQKNIIVLKRLICKIFDFGQSFHYKISGTNHRPKYTLLYASPEVVTSVKGRVFTQKSDVFSLGIMMHMIFFGEFPYWFKDKESFQKSNFLGQLRQRTYYTPQQQESNYGNVIIPIISQMILKCLDMDESKRPYLDWITLILRSCLNFITSQ